MVCTHYECEIRSQCADTASILTKFYNDIYFRFFVNFCETTCNFALISLCKGFSIFLHHSLIRRLHEKGEKPFKCTLCTSEFIIQADLNRHLKRAHKSKKKRKVVQAKKLLRKIEKSEDESFDSHYETSDEDYGNIGFEA